ncbi:methyltransferase [Nocardia sp. NPDC051030]|uniref:class I SAM-dependent methyltransferase n=1 Tax=Nocardia sp. NPDC051030 TaxID=3155162 RepID=UPI003447DD34
MTHDFAAFGTAVDQEDPVLAWQRLESRWWSPRPVHRQAHRRKIDDILPLVEGYPRVLDITRGASVDGILGVLAASRGARVTIVSPASNHLAALRRFADRIGADCARIEFVHCAKIEDLDVGSADVVTALHILEHAPHPRALLEVLREHTRRRCVLAFPSAGSPATWVRMGGGDPYTFDRDSLPALARGLARTVTARLQGRVAVAEHVDEYGTDTVHRWYFPAAVLREIEWAGFHIDAVRPDSLAVPWSGRATALLHTVRPALPGALISRAGFGTHVVLRPVPA